MATNIKNFSLKKRGTIVALTDACFSVGPAALNGLYGLCFINSHFLDPQNQDFPGYWLLIIILSSIVWAIGMIFIRVYRTNVDSEEIGLLRNDTNISDNSATSTELSEDISTVVADAPLEERSQYDLSLIHI